MKRIYKQLEQAKAKDDLLDVFGAHIHEYRLAPPASENAVETFEHQQGISLPEEYRRFLLQVGNGGAGPYYGLYSLADITAEINDNCHYRPREKPDISPEMSDEAWNRVAGSCLYAGILPIGTQGCTLMTGILLHGAYCGQVVYFDLDCCSRPFFVREQGFLAWYERWLREALAGYDLSGSFGINLDGTPEQLMEQYPQTDNAEEKSEIIDSFYKFRSIPKKIKLFFKQMCDQESDTEILMQLVKLLAHFHTDGLTAYIEKLWEYGAYGEAISVINQSGGLKIKEKWWKQIYEMLPQLQGNAFTEACITFWILNEHPDIHAGILSSSLTRKDLSSSNRIALYRCIRDMRNKEAVLDYFLDFLLTEEDAGLLLCAVQSMTGVQDRRLQEVYVRLLDRYRTYENTREDYKGSQTIRNGCCFGPTSPEGRLVSVLKHELDEFGMDRSYAWRVLMNDQKWKEWKQQNGYQ